LTGSLKTLTGATVSDERGIELSTTWR